MLFDTHAHLDDRAFHEDREALITGLPEKGVGLVMNPGCSLESSRHAVALAEKYDHVYAAVGSHPDVASEVNAAVLEEYRKLRKLNAKVKAIGEIGIDYHYEDIPREIQLRAFRGSNCTHFVCKWSWHRNWDCRSSFTNGKPTRTAWQWCGNFRM